MTPLSRQPREAGQDIVMDAAATGRAESPLFELLAKLGELRLQSFHFRFQLG